MGKPQINIFFDKLATRTPEQLALSGTVQAGQHCTTYDLVNQINVVVPAARITDVYSAVKGSKDGNFSKTHWTPKSSVCRADLQLSLAQIPDSTSMLSTFCAVVMAAFQARKTPAELKNLEFSDIFCSNKDGKYSVGYVAPYLPTTVASYTTDAYSITADTFGLVQVDGGSLVLTPLNQAQTQNWLTNATPKKPMYGSVILSFDSIYTVNKAVRCSVRIQQFRWTLVASPWVQLHFPQRTLEKPETSALEMLDSAMALTFSGQPADADSMKAIMDNVDGKPKSARVYRPAASKTKRVIESSAEESEEEEERRRSKKHKKSRVPIVTPVEMLSEVEEEPKKKRKKSRKVESESEVSAAEEEEAPAEEKELTPADILFKSDL